MKQLLEKLPSLGALSAFFLFWIIVTWAAVIMAIAGWFSQAALSVIALIAAVVLLLKVVYEEKLSRINYKDILIFILILYTVSILGLYAAPTIFSGRDQGSLSEAAVRLAQNHKPSFSDSASGEFFKIYGPGKALNYPGFNYTQEGKLITQFPIGYISWLAVFYSWFGMNGLVIANCVSFLIFLMAFRGIAEMLLKPNRSWMALVFALTGFIFIWLNKFTLGENLALALLWVAIYEVMKYCKEEKRVDLFIAMLSLGLLLFIRIEALAFWIMLLVLLASMKKNNMLVREKAFTKTFYALLVAITAIFAANVWIFRNSYIGFLKSVAKPFFNGSGQIVQESIFNNWMYFIMILLSYSLLSFVIFGILGIFYSIRRKDIFVLIPFVIVAPTFIYLLFPNVSLDHPWMLRRFAFSIIPAAMLYTLVFFDLHIKRQWQYYFLTSLLVFSNLVISVPFITFVPYRGLARQVAELSSDIRKDDLILVDQRASGDNWSMITGPMGFLGGLQAVYLVNIDDISKIDTDKFGRILLIAPDEKTDYYLDSSIGNSLIPLRDYSLEYETFGGGAPDFSGNPISQTFPQKLKMTVSGKIYQLEK
jgi:hypothetical protein